MSYRNVILASVAVAALAATASAEELTFSKPQIVERLLNVSQNCKKFSNQSACSSHGGLCEWRKRSQRCRPAVRRGPNGGVVRATEEQLAAEESSDVLAFEATEEVSSDIANALFLENDAEEEESSTNASQGALTGRKKRRRQRREKAYCRGFGDQNSCSTTGGQKCHWAHVQGGGKHRGKSWYICVPGATPGWTPNGGNNNNNNNDNEEIHDDTNEPDAAPVVPDGNLEPIPTPDAGQPDFDFNWNDIDDDGSWEEILGAARPATRVAATRPTVYAEEVSSEEYSSY